MLGRCGYLVYENTRCNRVYRLKNVIFRDPNAPSYIQMVDLCESHYNEITGELNERILGFQVKLANLISQKARERKLARENDSYFNDSITQHKIEDLIALKKKLQNTECRNYLCMQDLTKLNPDQKIYSMHTFRYNGKRQFSFYFCSVKCYNFIRAKCGILVPIQKGQTIF